MALLGYIGSQIHEQSLSIFENTFGGDLITLPSIQPPPLEKIKCMQCSESMDFLMQLYCPIGDSEYHRNLYFFVCLKRPCQVSGNNWRVLRSQCIADIGEDSKSKSCTSWCAEFGAEDDDDEASDGESWGPVTTNNTKEVKCKSEEKVTEGSISCIKGRFQCHPIDIYEDSTNITESILDNNECDSEPPVEEESSSSVKHFLSKYSENVQIDKEFIEEDDNTLPGSFSDTLLAYLSNRGEYGCEDIRYCWSGQPIFNGLPPRNDLIQCLTCPRCTGERVFELQIFSTINNSLKVLPCKEESHCQEHSTHDDVDDGDGELLTSKSWLLNIITVLVFTCRNSCWKETDDWIEECVIVQTDENVTKINNPIN
ncbi:unnamed protein product [Trichobilharzia szidati]|nr:unnamed protein product [Trichobilharzia szidati]